MKKFFTLLLCLFLTVCLGCSSSQPAPVTWGEDDLSVTQVSSQSVISYGMTRSEIDFWESVFSLSTMWVPGIKLRSPELTNGIFPC